jgi:hypothetical protein
MIQEERTEVQIDVQQRALVDEPADDVKRLVSQPRGETDSHSSHEVLDCEGNGGNLCQEPFERASASPDPVKQQVLCAAVVHVHEVVTTDAEQGGISTCEHLTTGEAETRSHAEERALQLEEHACSQESQGTEAAGEAQRTEGSTRLVPGTPVSEEGNGTAGDCCRTETDSIAKLQEPAEISGGVSAAEEAQYTKVHPQLPSGPSIIQAPASTEVDGTPSTQPPRGECTPTGTAIPSSSSAVDIQSVPTNPTGHKPAQSQPRDFALRPRRAHASNVPASLLSKQATWQHRSLGGDLGQDSCGAKESRSSRKQAELGSKIGPQSKDVADAVGQLLELSDRLPYSAVWQDEKKVWREFEKVCKSARSGRDVAALLCWLALQVPLPTPPPRTLNPTPRTPHPYISAL